MAERRFSWVGSCDAARRSGLWSLDLRSVTVGLACILAAAAMRLVLEQMLAGIIPFLLTFPMVILATLLAGAGAGWIALAGCQLLTFLFVLPHWVRDSGHYGEQIVSLVLSTASLSLAVWATASYRRSAALLRQQCEREVKTLSLLITEIDHRTKNNYQVAASLLYGQGLAAPHPEVARELHHAANRLSAMASVYQSLAAQEPGSGVVPLKSHIEQVCSAVRTSLLPTGIALGLTGDEVEVESATALTAGLVINEWLTNAVKHAFPEQRGTITVRLARSDDTVTIEVADDGIGVGGTAPEGIGSRLMASLIEVIHGRTRVTSGHGTCRALTIPLPA